MPRRLLPPVTTRYRVTVDRPGDLPVGRLTVAHLSDLHGVRFGKDNSRLLERVREHAPHLIAISGDVLRRYANVTEVSIHLLHRLADIAPVFVSRGNHDLLPSEWNRLVAGVQSGRVTFLIDEVRSVELGGAMVSVAGLDDLRAFKSVRAYREALFGLSSACASTPGPRVLLSHRPEFMRLYRETAFDLVLAGHAHGGQVRLPGVGAIWAPEQGLFPRHSDGAHRENGTTLVVSRGLGPSSMPFRVFNRPELIVIDVLPADEAVQNGSLTG